MLCVKAKGKERVFLSLAASQLTTRQLTINPATFVPPFAATRPRVAYQDKKKDNKRSSNSLCQVVVVAPYTSASFSVRQVTRQVLNTSLSSLSGLSLLSKNNKDK
jgi:hypothetical protein